jgi:hypothetical protein
VIEEPLEKVSLTAVEKHFWNVGRHEEPEVEPSPVGGFHRLFEAVARNRQVDEHQPGDAFRVQPGKTEGDHAADVVSYEPHWRRDVQAFQQLPHVFGLVIFGVTAGGTCGVAGSPQVGSDYLPTARGEGAHDLVPCVGGLGPAVQE